MTEPLHSDFVGIELALASLSPADVSMKRDELIFAAGARRAHSRERTARRVWQGVTAAVALVSIGAIVAIASSMSRSQFSAGGASANPAVDGGTVAENESGQRTTGVQDSNTVAGKPVVATPNLPTTAFSPIWNVNGWNTDRLHEVGISIKSWSHELQTEDPPLDWVEIAFDCSPLPKEQDVLMTAWLLADDSSGPSASRAERGKMNEDSVSLLLAARDNYRKNSYVTIYIWKQTAGVGSEAHGYQLSLKRILELAKETDTSDEQ